MTLGGFTSAGVIFDVLTPTPAYAAQADLVAMEKISDPANFGTITAAALTKYDFKYTVYELVDSAKNVKYVGRTRQDIEVRKKQHWYTDPKNKKGLDIRVAQMDGKLLMNIDYKEVRGLEHLLYQRHTENGIKLLNDILPLDVNTKSAKKMGKMQGYLDAAWDFLKKVK